jgi:multiple sugar transport system permease protein
MTRGQPPATSATTLALQTLRKRAFSAEAITAYLFILPSLVGFVAFYGYPAVRAVLISFTEWNLLRAPRPVGLGNYERLLSDPLFWNAMKVTGLYVLYNIPFQTVLGLFMAVAMHRLTQSLVIRGVLVLPYLVSNVVIGLAFLWVLDPLLGTMNMLLGWFGIPRQPFLGSPDQALLSIAGINIWRHMGFVALLFYAGLQSIPKELYEAGTIDGAGEWKLFRYISLPLLRPVMVFVLVTSVIGSFQIFDTIAVTTQGGPVNATRAIVWYIYENAFQFFRMGYASALSVVLFLILITVTIAQMRLLQGNRSELE